MTAPAARTLAEIVAEGRRLEETFQLAVDLRMPTFADELISRRNEFRAEHWPALLAVAEKTLALFTTLDYVEPGWREETCTVGGDEVNRAWYELEKSLGLGPAAVRGEEKTR